MRKPPLSFDILLKVYGVFAVYLLSLCELIKQYLWLIAFRTGLISGPDETFYCRGSRLLITGGMGSIGFEVAKKALQYANYVIILDITSKEEANERLQQLDYSKNVEYFEVDLRNLENVKEVCKVIIGRGLVPEIILFNAGVMVTPYEPRHGVESQFLVSYLSHCLVLSEFHHVIPKNARIVFVSSVCHKVGFLQIKDLGGRCGYSPHLWYAQAKICQLLLMAYLVGRTRLHINAVHPGIVISNLYKHAVLKKFLKLITFMTPAEAALCPAYVCLSSELCGTRGKYLEYCKITKPNQRTEELSLQKELFSETARLLMPYTDFTKLISQCK